MKLKIENKDKLYFTSDSHFGHNNILGHSNRPFKDIKDHDEALIRNWNEVVPEDGIVIHQGDFAFKANSSRLKWILESLNGKIYLVEGNHEKDIMKKAWARSYFEDIQQRYDIEVEDNGRKVLIVADHYPMYSWNKSFHGSFHTYGHVHGNTVLPRRNSYEVGVDTNNYYPISYDELMEKIKEKNLEYFDKNI